MNSPLKILKNGDTSKPKQEKRLTTRPYKRKQVQGHRNAGRKSDFDSSNLDHILLDSMMPKEEASSIKYLNFGKIHQPWLKELAKKFIHVRSAAQTRSQLKVHLQSINFFSEVLRETAPNRSPENIDREDIHGFVAAMARANIKPQTKTMYLGTLKTFLETCAVENWGEIKNKVYVHSTDYPKKSDHQPKAIPEFIMTQIDKMILELPAYLRRQMTILRDTGMRVTEMLTLTPNCLVRDSKKVIGLRYMIWKTKKEHQIPVSQAVIDVVTEQRDELILESKKKGTSMPAYLFPAPHGGHYSADNIRKLLKRYIEKFNIRDTDGNLFDFHPHRFRHTLGTRMINNGVQQHIVQKMLGHETPVMTGVYAEINDRTLKIEFDKYQGRLVDIYGEEIKENAEPNSSSLAWLAKNINAQALPNGYCGIPVIMSDCPTANSCLTCTHFRTDEKFLPQHEVQLTETNKILDAAREKGWMRQIETNTKVKASLERIVNALKSDSSLNNGAPQ